MKLILDRERCIGAGACVLAHPKRFSIEDGKAKLDKAEYDEEKQVWIVPIKPSEEDAAREAASNCPVRAIQVKP